MSSPSAIHRRPGTLTAAFVLLATVAAGRARAEGGPGATHREINVIPIAGGDSDVGFGGGAVGDWARVGPECKEYCSRLEVQAFATGLTREGHFMLPYQDYSALLTLPRLGPEQRVRLDIRGSFTDERTLKYYGIGNATPFPAAVPEAQTEYERIHPALSVEARMTLTGRWFLQLGNVYTHSWLDVPASSILAQQQASGPPEIRALLGGFGRHGLDLIELGVQYDSRDNEITTRRGMFHALQARFSPAIPGWLPYDYVQLDATLRFYAAALDDRVEVGWRLVGDALMGSPPFYELARFDDTPAIGGGKAVRGVPAQRYHGKVKLFENLEARLKLFDFKIRQKPLSLALAAFFDAGRSWTELSARHPELDGTGLGLKYGVGGGIRLQEGATFVVRGDVAWSPDARPIAGYFAAGEIF